MKFESTKTAEMATGSCGLTLKSVRLASAAVLAFSTGMGPLAHSTASAEQTARNYIKMTDQYANSAKEVRLGLDKSIVIDLPADAHDILVANPEVADAVTRTSRRLYIFGKKIGQTNIFVFDGRGKQIAALELTIERDISGLDDTIRRLIPNSDVKAEMMNDNVVLTGSVTTPLDAAKAVRLAEIFVKGGEATEDNSSSSTANIISLAFDEEPESQVVNMLKIDGEDQVHLKVMIAEIQRSVVKQLGFNTTLGNNTLQGFSESQNGFSFLTSGSRVPTLGQFTSGSGGGVKSLGSLVDLNSTFQALERNGVMRTLAEPSLTAISGEAAHFRVGGEYPVPKEITAEGTKYEQQEYGIALSFTPVVLSAGRISLKIRTEVSEPTTQGVNGGRSDVNILSIRKRLADTTVELPSGGSMVIAGLVKDDVRQAVNGQPGLMDIPFFGTLFRSREFIRNESEVVVIVTPYLVRATARSKLTQPDKNFQPATDAAGYFMGRINRVYGTKQGDLPKGRYTGSIGFILK